ncbi:MAG: hypothetical protein ABI359_09600 [Ginsengibacter sp.]
MRNWFLISLVASIFVFGCTLPVHYMGRSYPPTTNVDIYYSPHDVKKDYEVIGKVNITAPNLPKAQNGILNEAKRRGADGVIYTNMQNLADVSNGMSFPPDKVLNADFIKYK